MAVRVIGFDPLLNKAYRETALGPDIVAFLAWCELGGMSPKTVLNYEPDLARGALMFPDKAIGDITGDDLAHIGKTFPPASRRVRLASWRSFYKWARRTRRVLENPCEELPDIKRKPQRVIDTFTDDEITALYALPVRDAAPVAVLLEAGLRNAEARKLRLHDCLPKNRQVTVLDGKGGRDRVVPMSPTLHRLLIELVVTEGLAPRDHVFYMTEGNHLVKQKRVIRDRPPGHSTFAKWWERCLEQAAIRYRKPHTARHTYATRLRRQGVPLDDLQVLLGHSSISTTSDLYVHMRVEEIHGRLEERGLAVGG